MAKRRTYIGNLVSLLSGAILIWVGTPFAYVGKALTSAGESFLDDIEEPEKEHGGKHA